MIYLRQFQSEVVEKVMVDDGSQLIVAPTGAGKTIIAAEVIRRAEI